MVLYVVAVILVILGLTLIIGASLRYQHGFSAYGYSALQFVKIEWRLLSGIALVSALFILGATIYKTSLLSSGGGRVAMDMGGTLVSSSTNDPLRRRLRNVVEEMSIASGVPVPDIYVLENERSINAFAAGFAPGDAAIAVTRGTLELLDRDELQGVIAHEFSHVLNGDMRLNIRLMGVLFGIMAIGLMGQKILYSGRHVSLATRNRGRGTLVIYLIGLALALLGAIGVLAARLIKAGISRQREYLADASAVQFTRQKSGLANALKKIGGYSEGSYLDSADPEEVSHMLFSTGAKLRGLMATHPPLTERIQALDPAFKPSDYPVKDENTVRGVIANAVSGPDSGASSAFAGSVVAEASVAAAAVAEAMVNTVGQPQNRHVEYAGHLRSAIPQPLYDAAHSSENAYLLVIALVLDRNGQSLERQLNLAEEKLGRDRARLLRRYYDELAAAHAEFRLPLLEIAFPALRLRPAPQLEFLVDLTGRMIEVDGETDLYEYCFYRILKSNLGQAINPTGRREGTRASRKAIRDAAITLLSLVARFGHDNDRERAEAFRAGAALFGTWAQDANYASDLNYTVRLLNKCLDVLTNLKSKSRSSLISAISAVVLFDGNITVTETELVRAICASLDCPLPPILSKSTPA